VNEARRSGMRGSEREEKPAERPGDNYGGMQQHVMHDAQTGDHYLNLSSLTDTLERQASGPHDDKAAAFKKPNADKFEKGATQDSAKEAKGNEND